jgi:hypothetical protein
MPNQASPIKRRRRTKDEINTICNAMEEVVAEDSPMTVRQVFYRMVAIGVIEKSENEYQNTVGRLLLKLRREKRIPYRWIADETRWVRKSQRYDSMEAALLDTASTYRRALWRQMPAYVEVWVEKEALAGVIVQVTDQWDVPLMVCKGFASESYLYSAAEAIKGYGKPAYLYLLTDHDPSGLAIASDIERRIRGFAPDCEINVERLAVTEEQIDRWSLPTRPTKTSDSRARSFQGGSVDLDAIPPAHLRNLVRRAITRHIDPDVLDMTRQIERQERKGLMELAITASEGE